VFDEDAEVFFFNNLEKAKEKFPEIWKHGIVGLTMKRKCTLTHTPIEKSYHAVRESPMSFPDFVIIPNDAVELKAHKMVLAGDFCSKIGYKCIYKTNFFIFSQLTKLFFFYRSEPRALRDASGEYEGKGHQQDAP
jgi:hypothetical protein